MLACFSSALILPSYVKPSLHFLDRRGRVGWPILIHRVSRNERDEKSLDETSGRNSKLIGCQVCLSSYLFLQTIFCGR